MQKSMSNVKTNLIYGLIVIVPVAVIIVVIAKLVEVLELVAKSMGFESSFGTGAALLLALIFLVFVCYGAGYLVQTQVGAWTFERFEKTVLLQVPGYRIIGGILKGFAEDKVESYQPALVQLGPPGTAVLGFIMDENDNDTMTLFVPTVPALTVGGLHIVERSRATLLEASHLDIVNCITEWGTGSNKVIGKSRLPGSIEHK